MIHYLKEFINNVRCYKRYWIIPIVIIFGILTILVIITEENSVLPAIYALF